MTTVRDVYQAGRIAYQTDGSGTTLATFSYDSQGVPASVQVGANLATAPRYYYVYNGHGDVVALVDASGNTVAAYSYDVFGGVTATESLPNGWSNPYRYDGLNRTRYDTETSLYWMSVRAYDPTSGRFISRDPLNRVPLAWQNQPYVYGANNPATHVDPSGQGIVDPTNPGDVFVPHPRPTNKVFDPCDVYHPPSIQACGVCHKAITCTPPPLPNCLEHPEALPDCTVQPPPPPAPHPRYFPSCGDVLCAAGGDLQGGTLLAGEGYYTSVVAGFGMAAVAALLTMVEHIRDVSLGQGQAFLLSDVGIASGIGGAVGVPFGGIGGAIGAVIAGVVTLAAVSVFFNSVKANVNDIIAQLGNLQVGGNDIVFLAESQSGAIDPTIESTLRVEGVLWGTLTLGVEQY